jgi:hypothetical protein
MLGMYDDAIEGRRARPPVAERELTDEPTATVEARGGGDVVMAAKPGTKSPFLG